MKIRSVLLTVLATSIALAACDKSENSGGPTPEDRLPKRVTISLPNINPQSRAIGNAVAAGSKVELKNFKVYFVDTEGNEVTVPDYDGKAQLTYFSSENTTDYNYTEVANGTITYHFLPYKTAQVVVVGNIGGEVAYTDLATKIYEVQNDSKSGETVTHPVYPLYGQASLVEKTGDSSDDIEGHQNVYTATVTLAPRVSRFEIYGFEYEAATAPNENLYKSVSVEKIALNHFYTHYNLVSKAPVEPVTGQPYEKVWATPNQATAWTWIQDRTTWCDALTLTLEPGDKKFVNGDPITAADPQAATVADEAKNIVTYGLTHVENKADNPELLVALHGTPATPDGAADVPFYLHAKFSTDSTNPAFESGKIYRVYFKFTDENIKEPQRCVELNVTVAPWTVQVVTPEL